MLCIALLLLVCHIDACLETHPSFSCTECNVCEDKYIHVVNIACIYFDAESGIQLFADVYMSRTCQSFSLPTHTCVRLAVLCWLCFSVLRDTHLPLVAVVVVSE